MMFKYDLGLRHALLLEMFDISRKNNLNNNIFTEMIMIREIEYFIINDQSQRYILCDSFDMPGVDYRAKKDAEEEDRYTKISRDIFEDLKKDIAKFVHINKNKNLYLDDKCSLEKKEEFLQNSVTILREEISKFNLDAELEKYFDYMLKNLKNLIEAVDAVYDRKSHFNTYTSLLEKSRGNFIDIDKKGNHFYPLIVDMILDYARILHIRDDCGNVIGIKKHINNYKYYRKRIRNEDGININWTNHRVISFMKKVSKPQIKYFVLEYYLCHLGNTVELHSLFRKLLILNTNHSMLSSKNMEAYLKINKKESITNIVIMGVNTKFFIN